MDLAERFRFGGKILPRYQPHPDVQLRIPQLTLEMSGIGPDCVKT